MGLGGVRGHGWVKMETTALEKNLKYIYIYKRQSLSHLLFKIYIYINIYAQDYLKSLRINILHLVMGPPSSLYLDHLFTLSLTIELLRTITFD